MTVAFQFQSIYLLSIAKEIQSMKTATKLLAALAAAMIGISSAEATTIDFSNADNPLNPYVPGGYASTFPYAPFTASGFIFETNALQGYLVSYSMSHPFQVPSGSDLFAIFLQPTGSGAFSPVGGGTFTLNSLNMNWWDYVWDAVPHPYSVTGVFADSSTLTISGAVNPGQFIPLALNWANLKSVSFSGSAGAAWDGGGFVGISDVIVNNSLPVPEPETYALMLAGLGLIGFVVRRRKRQAA
jgi:hypothetical protein